MSRELFDDYYQNNFWQSDESVSGGGSTLVQTAAIRACLPQVFDQYNIRTVLDIPCGDFNWWKEMQVDLDHYTGADIVPDLVAANQKKYGDATHRFTFLDITQHGLGTHDVIFCRDLLGHLSNREVKWALQNVRDSKSTYLIATTFPQHENVRDIETGQWRPINLTQYFGLPDPILYINEGCTEGGGQFSDKSLGLWFLRGERYR